MAVSKEFNSRIKRYESLLKQIEQLKLLPGLTGLASVPFMIAGLEPLILPIIVGVATAGLVVRKQSENREIFTPTPIDSNYRAEALEDTKIYDRIVMGMGMRLDDYKSGREYLAKRMSQKGIKIQGTELQKSYQTARANDFYPLYLQDDYLTRHMTFMGQTGVGKTEAQLAMLQQSVARGGGGIMVEMKGDGTLPAKAYEICKAYGAEKKFRLISLDNVDISHKYNPVFATTSKSAISTIMSLLSAEGEQFHKDVAKWGLNIAITVISGQLSRPKYTLQDLYFLISDINLFYDMYEKMAEHTNDDITSKLFARTFFEQFKNGEDKSGDIIWNQNMYASRMMGILSALQSFAKGDFAKVLCTLEPDIDLQTAIENGEIIVLSANTLKDKEGVSTFARLFMADLAVAIGEIQSAGTKPLIPFPIWLDEYASFKHTFHEVLFQLARSANVGLIIGVQGFNFLANGSEGKEFAKNVLANCWNHVFFDIRDDDTRDLAAKLAGTVINEMEQESEGTSTGDSFDKAKGGIVGNISQGTSVTKGTKQTREDQIQSEDLMLDAGDALWIGKYETYRTRLPYVAFKKELPDLHEEYINFESFTKQGVTGLNLIEKLAGRL